MKLHPARPCLAALMACTLLMLSACGGGGGGNPPATPANTGASAPVVAPPAPPSSPSGPDTGTPQTAPTVTIDMPAIFTPSQNMGLVFLQDGKERKIRYEDGIQVVSVVLGTPFEILLPAPIQHQLFLSIETNSNYVPGSQIYIGGNVMARNYPWVENNELGWDLDIGNFTRGFEAWYDHELPTTDTGYKVLKIKSVDHWGITPPGDIDLLVYSPRSPWNSTVPRGNEYEVMKLRLLPAEPTASSPATVP